MNGWSIIASVLAVHPPRTTFRLAKGDVIHPRDAGAVVSAGWPVGQAADFRFPADCACSGMHVQDFGTHWLVHRDEVHPECGVLEHVRRDAPEAWMGGAAALGALVGALGSKKPAGALIGLGVGLLLAAALLPRDRERHALRGRPVHGPFPHKGET